MLNIIGQPSVAHLQEIPDSAIDLPWVGVFHKCPTPYKFIL